MDASKQDNKVKHLANTDIETDEQPQTKPKAEKRKANSDSETSNKKKAALVGIKHFPSNRIRLAGQALYLDQYHCVLIVPILDANGVKEWNGKGYDAIVLASKIKQ